MAKILGIDHVGVAVRDVDDGVARYRKIFGAEFIDKVELTLKGSRMSAAYLRLGNDLVVLDGAVEPDGFVARFIERRGEGLHHIAVAVDDLDEYVRELEAAGVRIPHRESVGPLRREILLSPKDLCGVVVQVIEWKEGAEPSPEGRFERLRRFLRSQTSESG